MYLKSNKTVGTPSDDHKFLHFLSHFEKKRVENVLPRPGFEVAIDRLEAYCANHYTIATSSSNKQFFKYLKLST